MDIIQKIDYWGKFYPNKIAFISDGIKLTYSELMSKSDILAIYLNDQLKDKKIKSPIAIIGHKEIEMMIGFIGSVKSGHPYIPIDISMPQERIDKIVQTAEVNIILTPININKITENIHLNKKIERAHFISSTDPFYIIFTSGSTGEPKGVVITMSCLESFLNWHISEQKYIELKERFLNQAPFSFDLSIMDLYSSLITGGTLFALSKDTTSNPSKLYKTLESSEITVWVSTPSFVQLCLSEKSFNKNLIPTLKKFIFCGESLSSVTATSLLDRFDDSEVWNTYGPTEATVATTSLKITRKIVQKYNPLPLGFPKFDTKIEILKNKNLHNNDYGEIIIIGDNVSPGYLKKPELTKKSFYTIRSRRAYHTGDLGSLKDGMLFSIGRMDNQIKLHGHRVELGDIEANLKRIKKVRDAIVCVKKKNNIVDSLVAYLIYNSTVVSKESFIEDDISNKTNQLKKQLGEELPSYMIPRKIIFLNSFPMTSNGKADRKKLTEEAQA